MRTESTQFEFRASLFLNNMAVTMMEQGCYKQAFDTFKDALLAMRQYNAKYNNSNNNGNNNDDNAMNNITTDNNNERPSVVTLLQKAHERRLQQETPLTKIPLRSVSYSTPSVLSCESLYHPVVSNCTEYTFVRIDFGHDDDDDNINKCCEHKLDLPTTILLYNFAICHLCRAQCCTTKPTVSEKLSAAGLHLLFLSRDFLVTQYADATVHNNIFTLSSLLAIYVTVLHVLRAVLCQRGRREEALVCGATLTQLRHAARRLDTNLFLQLLGQRESAAAA